MPYYIKNRGKAFGPFNEQQLVELKAKGKISRTVEISENQTDWFTAENYPFLGFSFAASGASFSQTQTAFQQASGNAGGNSEPLEWLYSTDGKAGYGPVTASAIRQMLSTGVLSNTSYVWRQGGTAQFIKDTLEFAAAPPSFGPPMVSQPGMNTSKFCSACGNPLVASASMCPKCGSPCGTLGAPNGKSRLTYILLAFFFGGLGIHNFYAKRTKFAVIQLVFTLTSVFCVSLLPVLGAILAFIIPLLTLVLSWLFGIVFGFGWLGLFVWVIVEMITVTVDGEGRPFA